MSKGHETEVVAAAVAGVAKRAGVLTLARVHAALGVEWVAYLRRCGPRGGQRIIAAAMAAEAARLGWVCARCGPNRSNVYAPTMAAAALEGVPKVEAIEARAVAVAEAASLAVAFARPLAEAGETWEAVAAALALAEVVPAGLAPTARTLAAMCRNAGVSRRRNRHRGRTAAEVPEAVAPEARAARCLEARGVVGWYLADEGRPLDLDPTAPARVGLAQVVAARLAEGWTPPQICRAWILFRGEVVARAEWWGAEEARARCVRLGWLCGRGDRLLKRFEIAGESPDGAETTGRVRSIGPAVAEVAAARAAARPGPRGPRPRGAGAEGVQLAEGAAPAARGVVDFARPMVAAGETWEAVAAALNLNGTIPNPYGGRWPPWAVAAHCHAAGVFRAAAPGVEWGEVAAAVMARDGVVTFRAVRELAAELAAGAPLAGVGERLADEHRAAVKARAAREGWAVAKSPPRGGWFAAAKGSPSGGGELHFARTEAEAHAAAAGG